MRRRCSGRRRRPTGSPSPKVMSSNPAAAWRGHEALLSDESLAALGAAAAKARGEAARGAAHLRAWLIGERLARDAAEPIGRLARARAEATFTRSGHEEPLGEASQLLAAEPDPGRRRAISAAASEAARALLPAVEARERRLGEAAAALGYPSTAALGAELRGQPPAALAALAEAALARTDATWSALLSDLAARAGMAPADVRVADLPRLLRGAAPPSAFHGARQLEVAGALLRGLGLDLAAQPNVQVDAGGAPGQAPADARAADRSAPRRPALGRAGRRDRGAPRPAARARRGGVLRPHRCRAGGAAAARARVGAARVGAAPRGGGGRAGVARGARRSPSRRCARRRAPPPRAGSCGRARQPRASSRASRARRAVQPAGTSRSRRGPSASPSTRPT